MSLFSSISIYLQVLLPSTSKKVYLCAPCCTGMEKLTASLCWNLVKKEGRIAIWKKPTGNSCYINREDGAEPPLCEFDEDLDDVWYYKILQLSAFQFNYCVMSLSRCSNYSCLVCNFNHQIIHLNISRDGKKSFLGWSFDARKN